MKNIHILPTDKPSRLHFTEFFEELVFTPKYEKLDGVNIYITSDEEIKEGDWVKNISFEEPIFKLDGKGITYVTLVPHLKFNKIILTTDQALIAEGIQQIDNEFLEWFVKNPSCESVEVEIKPMFPMYSTFIESIDNPPFYGNLKRKIIIPKEQQKQRLEKYSERFNNKENELVQGIFNSENWGNRLVNEELKQETLEEASEQYAKSKSSSSVFQKAHIRDFISGAKWQQEQIGKSEFLQRLRGTLSDAEARRLIFETFKNK